ncbi:inositol polyphosphate-5-phosphatase A-like isoform X2 [Armigeres subalbatus]|uniref:inositol polyphosphate-5-phosphatase A-like isoform X2 n=1 Tax=Armigeres subalbatus TaxID=124917 RepID=UPI002ED4EFC6
MENPGSLPFLLVTANVGSVFEDPSRLLSIWIQEFLSNVASRRPAFIALHLQEVGGKTYDKSMEYVQEFIKNLCESAELADYNRIRVYLDEDYNSAEHFTALGNLYFAIRTIDSLQMWNFLTHEWESVEGKNIHTGNIESVASKEKAKFPQQFFPECKWSRKGFLRTRWSLNGTVFDLVNIHLFHDASNLAACEEYPSVYCKSRRRALVHTLERFHQDSVNQTVPYFVFGDFNFRCDTEGVIKKLTEDLTMHRVPNPKNDSTKVQYRDSDGSNVLTVGKKEFNHHNQSTFKESWLRQYDRELDSLRSILHEYPITFPPSYPYEEDPGQPGSYMSTRCPAWCDRILISPAARKIIDEREHCKTGGMPAATTTPTMTKSTYGIMGEVVCMGDHKPVFLHLRIKTSQGTQREISADELRARLQEYDDLNARISDEPSRNSGLILRTHYVQITPSQSQDSSGSGSVSDEACFGRSVAAGAAATVGLDDPGVPVDDGDTVFYHQHHNDATGAVGSVSGSACSSMIFRETTV